MINAIIGKINKFLNDYILVESFGIEWKILMSTYSIEILKKLKDQNNVYIGCYLHSFENGNNLYGFAETNERKTFLSLIKVQGISARQAIKILSSLEYKKIIEAILNEDESYLLTVNGVGKKTAEKIILTLKENKTLISILTEYNETGEFNSENIDLINSLIQMGFNKNKVIKTVNENLKNNQNKKIDELLKICVIQLSS